MEHTQTISPKYDYSIKKKNILSQLSARLLLYFAVAGLNLGSMRPNFDSMPSNVAKAMRYPPMWSGFLDNTSSKCTDFASEPSGRLQTQGKPDCKMSWGNVCQGGGGLIFSPNICMNQNNLILVNFTPNYADMTFIDYIFRNLKKKHVNLEIFQNTRNHLDSICL